MLFVSESMLADPNREEEDMQESSVTICLDASRSGALCCLWKRGGTVAMSQAQLNSAMDQARNRVQLICKQLWPHLMQAMSVDESK
jgi:exosome complex RNA-binding protein Rrp42 (RNase PH superfamily)